MNRINDLITFKQYYSTAAEKIPADSFFHETLNHKFRHSIEVLHWGQYILEHTPELRDKDNFFRDLAQKALLFHDVGRFEEAVRRYETVQNGVNLTDTLQLCDHGRIGFELLQNRPSYNDMRILFSLLWHGKMMEDVVNSVMFDELKDTPYFKETMLILRLVRDADKLANLRVNKELDHLRQDIFYKQLSAEILNAPISTDVMNRFLSHQVIISSSLRSFADRIIMVISWFFDLNYKISKKIFKQQHYADFFLEMLSQYHKNPRDITQIKDCINHEL